jgi:outer membrane immunogenic protein
MIRRSCITALFATACSMGAASAADIPAPIYRAPAPPPYFNWSGFYAGVNIGGSFGHQRTSLTDATGTTLFSNSRDLDGVIGGGQIGWNWQGSGSPWVFGLEADIQGSGQNSRNSFAPLLPGGTGASYEDKLEWFGTVRGRVGYAMGDQGRWLPYITGGLAYGQGNINGSATSALGGVAFDSTNTYVGWTVGAGVEWAFWQRWSAKFEYLYMDLGHGPTIALATGGNVTTGRMTDNIVRGGVNLRF